MDDIVVFRSVEGSVVQVDDVPTVVVVVDMFGRTELVAAVICSELSEGADETRIQLSGFGSIKISFN